MPEHEQSGIAVVHAPHPQRLYAWVSLSCGGIYSGSPPVHLDPQDHVDAWFDARRYAVAWLSA